MSPNNSKGGYSKLPSSNASLTKPNPRVSRPISSSGPLGQISASGIHSTRTGFDIAQQDSFPIGLDSLAIRPPFVYGRFSPTGLDDPQDENESHYYSRSLRRVFASPYGSVTSENPIAYINVISGNQIA
jgi:hypothetical protein